MIPARNRFLVLLAILALLVLCAAGVYMAGMTWLEGEPRDFRPEHLDKLAELAGGPQFLKRKGHFVVGGCGLVGRKIRELLSDVDEEVVAADLLNVAADLLDVGAGEDIVNPGRDFRFAEDDTVYVCGSPKATYRFVEEFS